MPRKYVRALVVVITLFQTAIARAGWEEERELIASLSEHFAAIRTVQADFQEIKTLALFTQPMRLNGRFALEAPDRFVWRIEQPMKYTMVLRDGRAQQWDEETRSIKTVVMGQDPMLANVIGQIRQWFSGAFDAIAEDYDLTVVAREPLELRFTPRPGALASHAVRGITIRMGDDRRYIENMVLEDTAGDRTEMTFSHVIINEELPAAVWNLRHE